MPWAAAHNLTFFVLVQTLASWQSPLTRQYLREFSESGIRAAQGYDCPAAQWCRSRRDTEVGHSKSENFVDLPYNRVVEVTQGLKVPKIFYDLGWSNPKEAKLCVPFQYVPPQPEGQKGTSCTCGTKPKPKAAAWPLTMSAFLAKK